MIFVIVTQNFASLPLPFDSVLPFLSHRGVLGMNARNLLYIKPFNPRKAVAFADDKLKTKAYLAARGIPTAKMYARIESRKQLMAFDFHSLPEECVLKPNYGFGGEGILILKGRKNGQFLEQGKRPISEQEMREHIEDILDGKFSVNGMPDTAFFEKILVPHDSFAPFRPAGLPDIRMVVFNLVPVMAMVRIPTAESGGKANVHMGGIGIGIDIAKGITTHAVQYGKIVKRLPHGAPVSGIPIAYWEEMLLHAARIQYITNIGYLAVDLTLDQEQGPVLLEVNARAGLAVQIANLAPLRARLERVEGISVSTPEKGVHLAQELFGRKIGSQRSAKEEDERPILGTREVITIPKDGEAIDVPAHIAPDQERTLFSPELITQLREDGGIEAEEGGEPAYRVKFTLGGRKIQTVVREGEMPHASVRAIIGRRDLSGFLIDPAKTPEASLLRPAVKEDDRAIDRFLAQVDKELLLLKFLKPENLAEERVRAKQDPLYNPVFQYRPLPENIDQIERELDETVPGDSPIGHLFKKKRTELLHRIRLLKARGDARRLTDASSVLYGSPSSVLMASAGSVLRSQIACDLPPPENKMLTAEQAAELFEEVLQRYGLHDWQVKVRPSLVADCTVGGTSIYLREGAKFSREHVSSLIAHEIETHVLTAENGVNQPFELFRRGFASYLDTQEGLAIWSQNRVLSPHHEKRYGPARNVLAIAYALEHSFAETRRYLEEELFYRPEKALSKAIDLKRGMTDTSAPGGFTKGLVYFRGLRAIEHYLQQGGDLARLYIGKIALEDLDLLEQIPGVKAPILLPMFLREEQGGRQS
jgi:alpha-L-glutamate ligase-like protein/uncharacterized protein (TIGR02421 family)